MSVYVAAARQCDATVARGAAEPLRGDRLHPGRLRELLDGPLRRRPPVPPSCDELGAPECKVRTMHGGALPGGSVLHDGIVLVPDALTDPVPVVADLRRLHCDMVARQAAVLRDKVDLHQRQYCAAAGDGLSRLERVLHIRTASRKCGEPPAEPPPPVWDWYPERPRDGTLHRDDDRFRAIGAHRAKAAVARQQRAAYVRRTRHAAERRELASCDAADIAIHTALLDRAAADRAAAAAEKLRVRAEAQYSAAAAAAAAAAKDEARRMRVHPVDILQRTIAQDLLDERAQDMLDMDDEAADDAQGLGVLERCLAAEHEAHREEDAADRQRSRAELAPIFTPDDAALPPAAGPGG